MKQQIWWGALPQTTLSDDGQKHLLSMVAEQWLASKLSQVKPITLKMYAEKSKQISDHFGGRYMEDISPEELQEFLNHRYQKGDSRSNLEKFRISLGQIFTFAIYPMRIMSSNPCMFLKTPRFAPKSEVRALSSDEMGRILQIAREDLQQRVQNGTLSDLPFSMYPVLMAFLGLRRSEQIPLDWQDFDFAAGKVCVSRSVNFLHNQAVVYQFLKNGSRKKTIPIPKILMDVLNLVPLKQRKGLIFHSEHHMLTETQLKRRWNNYVKRTGMVFTQHMLRHTYATILFLAGVDVKDMQELLGHKNLETTLKIYTHLQDEMREQKAAELDAYIEAHYLTLL